MLPNKRRRRKKAAVATLEADLKNAKDNLEQAKSDAILTHFAKLVRVVNFRVYSRRK